MGIEGNTLFGNPIFTYEGVREMYTETLMAHRGGRIKRRDSDDLARIIKSLESQLEAAYNRLNNQTNETLIDSCIYEIFALNKKHEYWLERAKQEAGGA